MKLLPIFFVSALVVASCSAFVSQDETSESHLNLLRDVQSRQNEQYFTLHRNVLDQLLSVIDTMVQQGLEVINELRQKLENLLESLPQKGEQLVHQAIERISLYLEEVKQSLASKIDHFSECSASVPKKLDQISAKCLEGARTCHNKFVAQVNVIHENAKEQIDHLVGRVGELKKLANTCLAENSLFDKVKCVVHHVDDAFAVVSEVLSDTSSLLSDTVRETISLTAEVTACLLGVVQQSHDVTDKLAEEVSSCLREEKVLQGN